MKDKHCIVCGLLKSFSLYSKCRLEPRMVDIHLVKPSQKHMWREIPEHQKDFYGRGVAEDVLALQKQHDEIKNRMG